VSGKSLDSATQVLEKAASLGRLDADADVCGGQQAQQEQPLACVVLVLYPETGAKPHFLAFFKSPPVLPRNSLPSL